MPKKKVIIFFLCLFILIFLNLIIFHPIFTSKNIIINFAVHPFNICTKYPIFWYALKITYLIVLLISSISISYVLVNTFLSKKSFIKEEKSVILPNSLSLKIGYNPESLKDVVIPEKSLFQNILITGTIGSGKTSSAIYPFTEQLIKYKKDVFKEKIGILSLDVKGNFVNQIKFYAKKYNRQNDVIVIGLNSNETYNPLDKPELNSIVLANRLKIILTLLSPNNAESFWLDKAEQLTSEAIKLCRLYNNNYVNFYEIHKLINDKNYYLQKVKYLRNLFLTNSLSKTD